MRRTAFCLLGIMTVFGLCSHAGIREVQRLKLSFCCQPENDLYQYLTAAGKAWVRLDMPEEAIKYAPDRSAVLILADAYPEETVEIRERLLDIAAVKRLRVYVEYPTELAGMRIGRPRASRWERAVISSSFFAPRLQPMQILTINDCHFVTLGAVNPHIALARVAGFDRAVYGLPESNSPLSEGATEFPLLAKHPLGNILVATTQLSRFIRARYAPTEAWTAVWEGILKWLTGEEVDLWEWTPTVRPTYSRDAGLPQDAQAKALRRGVQWYSNATLLVHPSWKDTVDKMAEAPDRVGAAPQLEWLAGDGKHGLLEGFASRIDFEGYQPVRYWMRNDCMSEASMALAFDGVVHKQDKGLEAAGNLQDFIHFISPLTKGRRSELSSASFGLVGWDTGPGVDVYYGDDNARSMLGTMAASALLKQDRWDAGLLRCLLANLRTTGTLGFRGNRLDEGPLQEAGWRHHFDAAPVNYAPHYEAYLWACFLWAYKHTDYAPFLDRTKTAIKMTMEAYPDQWRWTNGIQQERARMLLPLAWLVRLEDTPEHRQWLRRIAQDLLELQDACGAIREALGAEGMGAYGPPKSNEEYGVTEATLIQENGDPVCDLLYTTNFAFLGLHEAAAATGEDYYAKAEDRLADFLCRIQVTSEAHPELDGAWFRGFDFKRWECWGSNADIGWGPWSIETGWTQGWITSVFGLRQMKTSFWELTAPSQVKAHLADLLPVMFPPEEEAAPEKELPAEQAQSEQGKAPE